MSEVQFGAYARYYDLLYREKDYRAEAAHILSLLERFPPPPGGLLEFGSGTGRHALCLARSGRRVTGVERSAGMLGAARRRLRGARGSLASGGYPEPVFLRGDMRAARLGRRFGAALALFHVVSYLNSGEHLRAAFETVRLHLRPGGIFIFDVWHTPGVLAEPPSVRRRAARNRFFEISRCARPVMLPQSSLVEVRYSLRVLDKASGRRTVLAEKHRMRHFSLPEVRRLARDAGFSVAYAGEWLTGRPLGRGVWSACFVLKAETSRGARP